MQESCRIAALTSTAPEQIEMIFYFFLFPSCMRIFVENTVRLTVTCVKFNYGPAVDALCVTQGDWEGAAAAGRRLCRQQQTQITMVWAAARSWACAITQPTDAPRDTLCPRLPLSISLHSGQWKRECSRHCWTLLSIIHVLLLK